MTSDPLSVGLVVFNGAAMGLLTAYFLRKLDSIRKSIASAIELWTTAILSSIVFGYPIGMNAIVGLAFITIGVVLYSQSSLSTSQKSSISSLVKKIY
jgi:drug/metabolite transporter (DMT)-like permease